MGQQSGSSSCREISDEEVLIRSKQYFTIRRLIDLLSEIEAGNKDKLEPIENYLVDLDTVIPSIVNDSASEMDLALFKQTPVPVAIRYGQTVMANYTVLHKYNDFILKELPSLPLQETKKSKAKALREEMLSITDSLYKYIINNCGDIGVGGIGAQNGTVVSPTTQ